MAIDKFSEIKTSYDKYYDLIENENLEYKRIERLLNNNSHYSEEFVSNVMNSVKDYAESLELKIIKQYIKFIKMNELFESKMDSNEKLKFKTINDNFIAFENENVDSLIDNMKDFINEINEKYN